jgi:hypothetical protein
MQTSIPEARPTNNSEAFSFLSDALPISASHYPLGKEWLVVIV